MHLLLAVVQGEMRSWITLPEVGFLVVTVLTFAQASWFTEPIRPCWLTQPLHSPYVCNKGFLDHTVFLLQGWRPSEIKVSGPHRELAPWSWVV